MFSCSSGREVHNEKSLLRRGSSLISVVFLFLPFFCFQDTGGSDSPFAGSDPESELQEAQLEFKTMQSRDEAIPMLKCTEPVGKVLPPP